MRKFWSTQQGETVKTYESGAIELVLDVNRAESLIQLHAILNQIDVYNMDKQEPEEIVVEYSDLPTFGGDEPEDTTGIYSWDKDELLTNRDGGSGQWIIEGRTT